MMTKLNGRSQCRQWRKEKAIQIHSHVIIVVVCRLSFFSHSKPSSIRIEFSTLERARFHWSPSQKLNLMIDDDNVYAMRSNDVYLFDNFDVIVEEDNLRAFRRLRSSLKEGKNCDKFSSCYRKTLWHCNAARNCFLPSSSSSTDDFVSCWVWIEHETLTKKICKECTKRERDDKHEKKKSFNIDLEMNRKRVNDLNEISDDDK